MIKTNKTGSAAMNTYRFAGLPSNSVVAGIVTFIVAGWLLVAGGIIIAESPATRASIAAPEASAPIAATPAVAPLVAPPAPVAASARAEGKVPPARA